jgi:uncharacterized Zn finger protein
MNWWQYDSRPRGPRPPANGIRAKTGRGQKFGQTWWGARWADVLDALVDPNRLQRGRSYARNGHVLSLDIEPGIITASVIGSWPSPYAIEIRLQPFTDEQWERAFDIMAGQARFAAKLLVGEMPQNIEEAFVATGVSLFPEAESDLHTDCSCPDWANPCKHVAAVYYLLGEAFDDDPFLIFRLRGREKETALAALRERRALSNTPVAEPAVSTVAPAPPDNGPALEEQLVAYWVPAVEPLIAPLSFEQPAVIAEAVKWLGPPEFWDSRRPFPQLFETLYASVARAALKTAFGEEV